MTKYLDIKFLPQELRHTPIGKRYESACLRMRLSAIEIGIMFGEMRLGEVSRDIVEPIVHFFRREYLRHSDLAHAALDELTKTYNWPPESTATSRLLGRRHGFHVRLVRRLQRRESCPRCRRPSWWPRRTHSELGWITRSSWASG